MIGKTPMGRMGEPKEVANAILFLISDEASSLRDMSSTSMEDWFSEKE